MLLICTVLKTEHITGSRPATPTAEARSWDFWQITVWDGNDAHACMVGRDLDPESIGQGEDAAFDVSVTPRRNTRSGVWETSVTLLRRVTPDEVLDRVPAVAVRAA